MFLPDDNPNAAIACPLTKRELQILYLFSKSMKNRQIADKLFISYHTVRAHRVNILQKLNANGKHGAVEMAKENNWWGYEEVLKRL